MHKVTLAFFIFFLNLNELGAQSASGQKSTPEESALNFYTKGEGHSLRLFNGRGYVAYVPMEDEHPYLKLDWEEGSVMYDGQLYQNVVLLYDVSIDQLITKYYNDDDIQLVRDKVSFFVLGKRKFIRIIHGVTTPGFHELLYDGKIKVLSKLEKKFLETVGKTEVHREFEEKTRWYLAINGNYFTIKNKKSVYRLFPEHEVELKKFIRDSQLSFQKTMGNDLVVLASFCEKFL